MIFILTHQTARQRAIEAVLDAPEGYVVKVTPKTRSLESNALMWALLTDLSEQVDWHGQRLTKEEWKDACTAALKNQKVIPGITGGFVVLGAKTSKMTKAEMSELVEFIYAFGAQHGVNFSEPVTK